MTGECWPVVDAGQQGYGQPRDRGAEIAATAVWSADAGARCGQRRDDLGDGMSRALRIRPDLSA
jgi:hypothetical protein